MDPQQIGKEWLLSLLPLFGIPFVWFLISTWKNGNNKNGKHSNANGEYIQPVPFVSGCWPLVGHGLAFSADPIGFIKECVKKYGSIFTIKVFRFKFAIICEKEHAAEFYNYGESKMSFFDILYETYFADAFFTDSKYFPEFSTTVRRMMVGKTQMEKYIPKMVTEAEALVTSITKKVEEKKEINFIEEALNYCVAVSSHCLTGLRLDEQGAKHLHDFSKALLDIIPLTNFVPIWLLRIFYKNKFVQLRKQLTDDYAEFIDKVRNTKGQEYESPFLRSIFSSPSPLLKGMGVSEIGDFLVGLLFTSTDNAGAAFNTALVDIGSNCWEKFGEISSIYLENKDYQGLLDDPYINACFMESARISTELLPICRKPKCRITVGGLSIDKDVDAALLCGRYFQVEEEGAGNTFKNPGSFNPQRFLEDGEPMGSPEISAWGGGIRNCPGKLFAVNKIKIALAHISKAFDVKVEDVSTDLSIATSLVIKRAKLTFTKRK